MAKKNGYEVGSANVFADIGLPDAEHALAKAQLASRIIDSIERRRLTQVQAAKMLRLDQPKISALKSGRLSGFSLERLMRILLRLGSDIDIIVKPKKSRQRARVRVA